MKATAVVVHSGREKWDVYIGRPSRWGNPFRIGEDGTRQEVILQYRAWLWKEIRAGSITTADLASLHGKRLGCYCAPLPCHGHVLAKAAAWAVVQEETVDYPDDDIYEPEMGDGEGPVYYVDPFQDTTDKEAS